MLGSRKHLHAHRKSRRSVAATAPLLCIAALLPLVTCNAARADEIATPPPARSGTLEAITPDAWFLQFGVADEVTAATVGAVWNLKVDSLSQRWGVFLEASVSRWQSRGGQPSDSGALTQIALIPTLRYWFGPAGPSWFVEGGIGATVTSSVYRSSDTHFSTKFNFGDHLGLGFAFGPARKDEVALRVEHFSNAGIKEPNPGKNFLQLRYAHRFD